MDEIKALELMKQQINKTDSLTATLYEFGIKAMEEVQSKKSIREQENDVHNQICEKVCKHFEKATTLDQQYNLVTNICPNCPLERLR